MKLLTGDSVRRALEVLAERPHLTNNVQRGRQCGGCQACCHTHTIHELKKPLFSTCKHQCDHGCAVHSSKPLECSEYMCMWLAGVITGGSTTRPDRVGLVVDLGPLVRGDGADTGDVTLSALEVWAGAAVSDAGWDLIQGLDQPGRNFCLVPYGAPMTGNAVAANVVLRGGRITGRGVFDDHGGEAARSEVRTLCENIHDLVALKRRQQS